jgi:hypothetical protein
LLALLLKEKTLAEESRDASRLQLISDAVKCVNTIHSSYVYTINSKRRQEEMKQSVIAERKLKIQSKPKADEVLKLMSEGWELGYHQGCSRSSKDRYWLQLGGLQRGGESKDVHASTVAKLINAGKIYSDNTSGLAKPKRFFLTLEK